MTSATAPGEAAASDAAPVRRHHPLLRFLAKRLAMTVGLLFGVTLVTFALVHVVPGGPVTANLSDQALNDPKLVSAFKHKWGLDQPVYVQYLRYIEHLVHGDMGTSQQTGHSVVSDLAKYVPATLELAIPTMVVSLLVGTGLGMLAARRHRRGTDQAIRVGALLGLSTPPFWLSLVALYVFFYVLGLTPSGGRLSPMFAPPPTVTGMYTVDAALDGQWAAAWDAAQHLFLPVAVLSCLAVSTLVRFVRAAMLEVLAQDYVRLAYAKGIPTRVILRRHVLRAALVPVLTVSGLAFAALLSGTVLVESIFSWPGIGRYAYQSATALDLPAIMGVSLFVAVVYTLVNLVVDLLYGVIDPRIRLT
ncbi:MAG: ABC transporter permease [Nocardioidaceae bacterium]